ncbi:MAG: ROK family protein [Acidimicrobiia bacterium]|nr:ROK family protein [Acidimicrobiia bacterium]MYC58152.1 ROK family protein [Acidimicrobiia bacterium]MYI30584.1 ROK family protein [Acidimicrobiia bacterium]
MEIKLGVPVLAIDIGGTKVAAGVVDPAGKVLCRGQILSNACTAEDLFERVLGLAQEMLRIHRKPVSVCGVGSGGPSRDNHRLLSPLNIAVWRDFPFRERLSQALQVEVHVDNDAKALALAEGWVGAAVGQDNYLAMVVSTGIGGGIVLNGCLLDGADGNAGHIGHVFVSEEGRADAAGVVGLLEGQASGSALADLLKGVAVADAPLQMRQRVGTLVGRGVGSVANLLDLRLAVVGGSVALGFGDDFFAAAQAEIDRICHLIHSQGTQIIPSPLGADGGIIGAAAVARQR